MFGRDNKEFLTIEDLEIILKRFKGVTCILLPKDTGREYRISTGGTHSFDYTFEIQKGEIVNINQVGFTMS